MSSKVIGFRVPGDIAEDLEHYCSEQDIRTADCFRKIVDDILYPSRSTQTPPSVDPSLIEKINELANNQDRLTDQFDVLSTRVDELTERTGQIEKEKSFSPGQEEPLTSAADLVKQVEDLKDSHGMFFKMLEDNADKIQRIFNLGKSYKSSEDRIGLIRPKIVKTDPFLGNKYIDLSEPLD